MSRRECQVIQLLVGGLTLKEAAFELGISPSTAGVYLERVQIKTGCPTKLSAIAYAIINGLVLINSA